MPELKDAFGYSEEIPEKAREIFMWLCQDVAMLNVKWNFYDTLFNKLENANLISELAIGSFNIIEESLRMDMTMLICRLGDPAKVSGRDNLSFLSLQETIDNIDGLELLIQEFLLASNPVRTYRNKQVGHNDLNTKIRPHENPIPGINRSDIEKIILLTGQILNLVYRHYRKDSEIMFYTSFPGDVESLLYWLTKGKEARSDKFL